MYTYLFNNVNTLFVEFVDIVVVCILRDRKIKKNQTFLNFHLKFGYKTIK